MRSSWGSWIQTRRRSMGTSMGALMGEMSPEVQAALIEQGTDVLRTGVELTAATIRANQERAAQDAARLRAKRRRKKAARAVPRAEPPAPVRPAPPSFPWGVALAAGGVLAALTLFTRKPALPPKGARNA